MEESHRISSEMEKSFSVRIFVLLEVVLLIMALRIIESPWTPPPQAAAEATAAVDRNTLETGTGSGGWHVPAGFYIRKGRENKEGMSRGGARVNLLAFSGHGDAERENSRGVPPRL